MFESGNFKRRKRMRRHSYKPGLYKGWLGEHAPPSPFPALYRTYPHSIYSTMSRYEMKSMEPLSFFPDIKICNTS